MILDETKVTLQRAHVRRPADPAAGAPARGQHRLLRLPGSLLPGVVGSGGGGGGGDDGGPHGRGHIDKGKSGNSCCTVVRTCRVLYANKLGMVSTLLESFQRKNNLRFQGQRRKRKRRRLTRNVGECLLGWSDLWRSLAVVWLSMLQRDLPADTGDSGCRCTCKSCCGRSRRRRNLPLPSPPPSQSSSVSVRLSYISACLASFVLFAFYTGVLTSLMTVSTYTVRTIHKQLDFWRKKYSHVQISI